jgi:hypothetical protein
LEFSGGFNVDTALPPGKETRYHWIAGWVDPRAGLDDMEFGRKKKRYIILEVAT